MVGEVMPKGWVSEEEADLGRAQLEMSADEFAKEALQVMSTQRSWEASPEEVSAEHAASCITYFQACRVIYGETTPEGLRILDIYAERAALMEQHILEGLMNETDEVREAHQEYMQLVSGLRKGIDDAREEASRSTSPADPDDYEPPRR